LSTSPDLLTQAARELGPVQARIDAGDAQAAAARDERAAIWRKYLRLGVQKTRLAELSGLDRKAIDDALTIRRGR